MDNKENKTNIEEIESTVIGSADEHINSDVDMKIELDDNDGKRSSVETARTDAKRLREHETKAKSRLIKAEKRNRRREADGGLFSGVIKALIYVCFVLVVSAFASYYIISVANDVFAFVKPDKEIIITLKEDATTEEVAELLEQNGVIDREWAFRIYLLMKLDKDEEVDYLSGDIKLNSNMNFDSIFSALTVVPYVAVEVRVTIPEGYTTDQIINLLVDKKISTREELVQVINEYPFKHAFVRQLTEIGYSENRIYRLEGYLYPDTYDFYENDDPVRVINKMLNNFDDKFWDEYEDTYKESCDKLGMTFDDIITLASIIQAEGKTLSDYECISSVFHNRFNSTSFPKMESCATIQYVLPERHDVITAEDLKYDSPYNTYMYEGLPPGAICNPGINAIEAAIYPDISKAVLDEFKISKAYFFCSDLTGKIYYAQTEAGHEKNKAKADKVNESVLNGGYYEE